MKTIAEQVEACRRGEHPRLVARLPSGWAVMGLSQATPGYCLLLADPVVRSLNDLSDDARTRFLLDMSLLGDAALHATQAARINYEMLGNLDPTLHAHIFPRSEKEPENLRTRPVWFYPGEVWNSADNAWIPSKHAELRRRIADHIVTRVAEARGGLRPVWQRAVSFAARHHHHALRKDGVTPYAAHPVRVALTVRQLFGCDDDAAIAIALLHDTIEDTSADYDDVHAAFGKLVADGVADLTKDMRMPEPEREPAYDARLRRSNWRVHLVKLADVYDNLSDTRTHPERNPGKLIGKARRAIQCAEPSADHAAVRRATVLLESLIASES